MIKTLLISNSICPNGKGGDYIYSRQILNALGVKFDTSVLELSKSSPISFSLKGIFLLPFYFAFPIMWRRMVFDFKYALISLSKYRNSKSELTILVDHFRNAWVIPLLYMLGFRKIILINHNIESKIYHDASGASQGIKSFINFCEFCKLFFFERLIGFFCDKSVFITEEDKNSYHSKRKLKFVLPPHLPEINTLQECRPAGNFDVLIIGSFYWNLKQNNLISFLDESSGLSVCIAGCMPDEFRLIVEDRYENVHILGQFKELGELSGLSRCAVAPDSVGGGFKLKILDYLALELPVFGLFGAMNGFSSICLKGIIFQSGNYKDLVVLIKEYLNVEFDQDDFSCYRYKQVESLFSKISFENNVIKIVEKKYE